jgi:hypothetical protein
MKAFAILFLASLLQAQSLDPQLNKILNLTKHFQKRSTKAFTIYTENPSFDFKLINRLSESSLSKACKTINQKTYSNRIHIFVFNSPECIEKVVGVKINGGAIPPSNILLSIYTNNNQTFAGPHEFMHIISHCFWGEAPSTWLNEGLAVFSDNAWWGYDLHAIAKTIKNIEHFDILKFTENGIIESDPNHYYPLAGSFVKYIVEKLGLEYLKLIWKNDPSTSNASNIDKLKLEWSEFLNTIQPIKEKYPS